MKINLLSFIICIFVWLAFPGCSIFKNFQDDFVEEKNSIAIIEKIGGKEKGNIYIREIFPCKYFDHMPYPEIAKVRLKFKCSFTGNSSDNNFSILLGDKEIKNEEINIIEKDDSQIKTRYSSNIISTSDGGMFECFFTISVSEVKKIVEKSLIVKLPYNSAKHSFDISEFICSLNFNEVIDSIKIDSFKKIKVSNVPNENCVRIDSIDNIYKYYGLNTGTKIKILGDKDTIRCVFDLYKMLSKTKDNIRLRVNDDRTLINVKTDPREIKDLGLIVSKDITEKNSERSSYINISVDTIIRIPFVSATTLEKGDIIKKIGENSFSSIDDFKDVIERELDKLIEKGGTEINFTLLKNDKKNIKISYSEIILLGIKIKKLEGSNSSFSYQIINKPKNNFKKNDIIYSASYGSEKYDYNSDSLLTFLLALDTLDHFFEKPINIFVNGKEERHRIPLQLNGEDSFVDSTYKITFSKLTDDGKKYYNVANGFVVEGLSLDFKYSKDFKIGSVIIKVNNIPAEKLSLGSLKVLLQNTKGTLKFGFINFPNDKTKEFSLDK